MVLTEMCSNCPESSLEVVVDGRGRVAVYYCKGCAQQWTEEDLDDLWARREEEGAEDALTREILECFAEDEKRGEIGGGCRSYRRRRNRKRCWRRIEQDDAPMEWDGPDPTSYEQVERKSKILRFRLKKRLTEELRKRAKARGVTVSSILCEALGIFLKKRLTNFQ